MKNSVLLPFGKTICQTGSGQGISEDTAALVDQILQTSPLIKQNVLELGSGNGIVSIMLAHYRPQWKIIGIEIQPHLVQLSRKNLLDAEVEAKFMKADLREYNSNQEFDLVVSNPPYFPIKQGRLSPNREKAIARHEIKCKLEDIIDNLKRNLKKKGIAFLIYPVHRLGEVEKKCKNIDLRITDKKIIQQNRKVILTLKWM